MNSAGYSGTCNTAGLFDLDISLIFTFLTILSSIGNMKPIVKVVLLEKCHDDGSRVPDIYSSCHCNILDSYHFLISQKFCDCSYGRYVNNKSICIYTPDVVL